MKAQFLKLAGVKTEKEFYAKFPDEKSFMAKYGKQLKKALNGTEDPYEDPDGVIASQKREYTPITPMKGITDFKLPVKPLSNKLAPINPPKEGMLGKLGGIGGLTSLPGKIMGSIQKINDEKKALDVANQAKTLTDLQLKASATKDIDTSRQLANNMTKKRQMMMPVNTGEEFFPIYGVGTEPLAKSGKKVKGKKAISGLATSMIGEGLNKVTPAIYGDNAGSELGGTLGGTVGGLLGPVGSLVGEQVGKLAGFALDRNPAKIKKANDATFRNANMMAMNNMDFSNASMEEGGRLNWNPQIISSFGKHSVRDLLRPDPTMDTLRAGGHLQQYTPPSERALNTGLDGLQVHSGGYAEPISDNPYSKSSTVMFRGASHAEGGIDMSYGKSPVEVERGEPAQEFRDGGEDKSLIVFGNLPISNTLLPLLGDPDAKGKKFKNYVADLSRKEQVQNKTIDKSTKAIDELTPRTSFEKLTFASHTANIKGGNMSLKDLAQKKETAAALQQAVNDSADEHGLVADDLAKGNVKYAKKGISISDRSAWDIPGKVGDWAEQKIGQAYQDYVPENAKNAIQNVGNVLSYPLESLEENWNPGAVDRAKQYEIDHPVIGGVAPAFGGVGKASKVFKMSKDFGAMPSRFSRAENIITRGEQTVEDAMEKAYPATAKAATKKAVTAKPSPVAAAKPMTKAAKAAATTAEEQSAQQIGKNFYPILGGIVGAGAIGGVASHFMGSDNTPPPQYIPMNPTPTPAPAKAPVKNELFELMGSRRQKFEDGGTAEWGEGILSKEELSRREQDHNVGKTALQNPYDPWIWGNPQQPMMQGVTPAGKQVPQQVPPTAPVGKTKAPVKGMTMADMIAARSPAMKLQGSSPTLNIPQHNASDFSKLESIDEKKTEDPVKDKFDWMSMVNGMIPYLRPSDAEQLDPRQLSGEMFALSQNQQEPVPLQTFQPQLTTPYDVSHQDMLNENQAAFRAAQRNMAYNPAAQSNLAAQQYQANQRVLGEQFRENQAMKNQTYAQNRQALDNAQLRNLQAYDVQAGKQAQAKSNTKEVAQNALMSISDKFMKNKLSNRTLQTYENLYNYRYDDRMRAQNMNPLAQFNTEVTGASADNLSQYEKAKALIASEDAKSKARVKTAASKNGSIVSSFKNL